MKEKELDALEAAAKVATPGPWYNIGCSTIKSEITYSDIVNDEDCFLTKDDDCAFIAAANPAAVLELIAELRKTKAERDWLAENMPNSYPECHCPEGHYKPDCNPTPTAGGKVCYDCLLCWLKAAKEATCSRKD